MQEEQTPRDPCRESSPVLTFRCQRACSVCLYSDQTQLCWLKIQGSVASASYSQLQIRCQDVTATSSAGRNLCFTSHKPNRVGKHSNSDAVIAPQNPHKRIREIPSSLNNGVCHEILINVDEFRKYVLSSSANRGYFRHHFTQYINWVTSTLFDYQLIPEMERYSWPQGAVS